MSLPPFEEGFASPDTGDGRTPEQVRFERLIRALPDFRAFDGSAGAQETNWTQVVLEALAYMRDPVSPADPEYLRACNALASRPDLLPYRQYFTAPQMPEDNEPSPWDFAIEYSQPICSCGSERVFLPVNPRTEFEASHADPIVLEHGEPVYIRPHGAPLRAAHTKVRINRDEGPIILFKPNPFSGSVNLAAPFGKMIMISAVETELAATGKPIPYSQRGIPILAVTRADAELGLVEIRLDSAVETFNPNGDIPHADLF